jgi:hypothetical protein
LELRSYTYHSQYFSSNIRSLFLYRYHINCIVLLLISVLFPTHFQLIYNDSNIITSWRRSFHALSIWCFIDTSSDQNITVFTVTNGPFMCCLIISLSQRAGLMLKKQHKSNFISFALHSNVLYTTILWSTTSQDTDKSPINNVSKNSGQFCQRGISVMSFTIKTSTGFFQLTDLQSMFYNQQQSYCLLATVYCLCF